MKKIFVSLIVAASFLVEMIFGSFTAKTYAEENFEAVTYTAPITLYWLSKAGVPEAVEYMSGISSRDIFDSENIPDYARVEKANAVYQEILYASLNDFIASGKYTNVMDLGCGVSPRGILMGRKGINYVGTDLESVAKSVAEFAPMYLTDEEEKFVSVVAADATDHDAMISAANRLKGKICIVEEGLLMYLSNPQQKAMLENIRDILKAHGGCYVTPDFVPGDIFIGSTSAIYGGKDALTIAKETHDIYAKTSEMLIIDNLFDKHKDAVDFIKSQGLKVEMRPLFTEPRTLNSMKNLNDKQITRIKKLMTKKYLWVITLDETK